MRTASSLAIFFAATSIFALAQSPAVTPTSGRQSAAEIKSSQLQKDDLVHPSPSSQEGCPVVFTAVRLDRPAEFLPTTSSLRARTKANLHLSYSNPSGKEIAFIRLTSHLKVKENRYTLDAAEIVMPLTFTPSTGELSTETSIPLFRNIVGFDRLALESVIFRDGSGWHAAKEHHTCGFASQGSLRVAK